MLRQFRYVLIVIAGFGMVLLLLWAVVALPPRLIDTSQIPDPAKRLDEVNGLRTNLLGVLAGLTVIAGAVVGALNFRETQRQNRAIQEQNRAVLDLQRRGQVTERFTRAIDQLGQQGQEKLDIRIGAVYALEQIARDSAELQWPIMEVLTAYLREHPPEAADLLGQLVQPRAEADPPDTAGLDPDLARRNAVMWETALEVREVERMYVRGVLTKGERYRKVAQLWARAAEDVGLAALKQFDGFRVPADYQAMATVIGRRHGGHDPDGQRLDLHGAYLSGVRWREAHLELAAARGAPGTGGVSRGAPGESGPH